MQLLAEIVVAHLRAGGRRDGELHRQTTLGGQVVERWDQLPARQVPGGAEMTMTPARGRGAAAARPLSYQRSAFSPQLSSFFMNEASMRLTSVISSMRYSRSASSNSPSSPASRIW